MVAEQQVSSAIYLFYRWTSQFLKHIFFFSSKPSAKGETKVRKEPESEEDKYARLHKVRVEAGKKGAAVRQARAKERVSNIIKY